MEQAQRPSHIPVPGHLDAELPRGIEFDLLLIEATQGLGERARLGDQIAVALALTERGFSCSAAHWLVREARLSAAVAAI